MTAKGAALLSFLVAAVVLSPRVATAQQVVVFEERPATGVPLLATGAALTGVGVLNLAAGPFLCMALFPEDGFNAQPATRSACIDGELVVGGILTAVGVPLLIVGASKYSRYKDWKQQHAPQYGLSLAPMRGGGAVGVSWAF